MPMLTTIQLPLWAERLTVLAPVFAVIATASAVFVSVLTFRLSMQIARWQASVAREQLRQNLYDRRFAVYMAFHELLVAVAEKDDVEAELRKANAARAHSPFLLDPTLGAYLKELHAKAFELNATQQLIKNNNYTASLPQPVWGAQASQLGSDKLGFSDRVEELAKKFEPFIRLKDLPPMVPSPRVRAAVEI
jgi:hypothetical protein